MSVAIRDKNEKIEANHILFQQSDDTVRPTVLRYDFSPSDSHHDEQGSYTFSIDDELMKRLMGIANDEPFLVFTILTSALNVCLFNYVETPHITIATPPVNVADDHGEYETPVVIISEIASNASFREIIYTVKNRCIEAYKNQNHDSRILALKSQSDRPRLLYHISIEMEGIHRKTTMKDADIRIALKNDETGIVGNVVYKSELYRAGTIEQFIEHYTTILKEGITQPGITVNDMSMISEREKKMLLFAYNDTQKEYSAFNSIHQMFEDNVIQNPDRTAVVFGDEKITYSQLNRRANRLARFLIQSGVEKNSLVGLFLDRSFEMIVGLLGIVKSGSAYVPLDPSYPEKRIDSMMKSAAFTMILTVRSLHHRLPENVCTIVCLDDEGDEIQKQPSENPDLPIACDAMAYMIFTSGSTGIPKGACVSHKGWTNLLRWFSERFSLNHEDRNLIISSFSFDITQRAIAMSLTNGGELHLLRSSYYTPELIIETIEKERITLLNCSPSTFYPLIEGNHNNETTFGSIASLRWLFLGGEAISASRLKPWVASRRCKTEIANVYGIAECTDVSTYYILKNYDLYIRSSVPVGTPIYNTHVYIVDNDIRIVPKGLVGEICIAGDGIGMGYINDQELTEKKFVVNPFDGFDRGKLYRTGDMGRFLPDGNIEYIGRSDYQVKVRGLRIELCDIEAVLRQKRGVREAVVVSKDFDESDLRLICFVSFEKDEKLTDNKKASQELREYAQSKLPPYMVPNFFIIVEEFPLSPNGKIDRNSLPVNDVVCRSEDIASQHRELSVLEESIVRIFADALKVKEVALTDNFFDLGGHSLIVTQVISRVNEMIGIKISQADLLTNPTAEGLVTRIEKKMSAEAG